MTNDYIIVSAKEMAGNKSVSGKVTLTHADYEVPLTVSFKVTIGKTTAFKPSLSAENRKC